MEAIKKNFYVLSLPNFVTSFVRTHIFSNFLPLTAVELSMLLSKGSSSTWPSLSRIINFPFSKNKTTETKHWIVLFPAIDRVKYIHFNTKFTQRSTSFISVWTYKDKLYWAHYILKLICFLYIVIFSFDSLAWKLCHFNCQHTYYFFLVYNKNVKLSSFEL